MMKKSNQRINSVLRIMRVAMAMLVLGATLGVAQTPNMINYQGVATNNAGAALANQTIKLRFKLHHSTVNGTVQYSEVRTVTTDATGQFSVQIGGSGATNVAGTWGAITWKNGDKFLQVEMDPAGGSNFVNMGTQQLVSVPYAQYSKMAATLNPNATIDVNQLTSTGATPGQVLQYNGVNWVPGTGGGGNGLSLPYDVSNASGTSFKINNTGTGASKAIFGKADAAAAYGVYGESMSGIAVSGYSNNIGSIAVFGSSLAGTGVKAYSYTGTALDVVGSVKISGGNTNPGVGKVLTSDAAGNATWKANYIGFKVSDCITSFPQGVELVIPFQNEDFDYGNAYNSNTNTYVVPVSGIYHFSAKAICYVSSNIYNINYYQLALTVNGSYQVVDNRGLIKNLTTYSKAEGTFDITLKLNAGDEVRVLQLQQNGNNISSNGNSSNIDSFDMYFCGHLIAAE